MRRWGRSRGWSSGNWARPSSNFSPTLHCSCSQPPAEAHAGDAAEDEAANAGPVTPPQPHTAVDILPVSRLALPTPAPRPAWTRPWIHLDLQQAWTQPQSQSGLNPDLSHPDLETRGHSPQPTLIYSQHQPLPSFVSIFMGPGQQPPQQAPSGLGGAGVRLGLTFEISPLPEGHSTQIPGPTQAGG